MRALGLIGSVAAVFALMILPAGADGPAPTVIQSSTVTAAGDMLSVTADVDWGGQAPVMLGTDPSGDDPTGSRADLDLTGLSAYVADGDEPVATFVWHIDDLTQDPPPEIVRYYWQFTIGGASFALQAKTTDLASAAVLAGTPEGIVGNVASNAEHIAATGDLPQFRLRGNCETVGVVNSCPHVAWVDGEFDADADEIRFHLPLDRSDTPQARFGATATATDGAWSSVQAAADTTQTRDSVPQLGNYVIPKHSATVTVSDASGATVASGPATIGQDLSVTADLQVAGLAGELTGKTVTLTACFGANCATSVLTD